MLSQYSSIFHEFLRNGILRKDSLLVRVIICAASKIHKVQYLRNRFSHESVCFEHIIVFLLSPLGWIEPLLVVEKLLWKPICTVSFCRGIFLRHALSLKNLNSSETDIQPQRMKKQDLYFFFPASPSSIQRHVYWQIGGSQIPPTVVYFPLRQMLTEGLMPWWREGCDSPAGYSPTCNGYRCSVLVWRMRAIHRSGRNIENTGLLFISIKTIKLVAERGMRMRLVLFLGF